MDDTVETIRRRAYLLWEQTGRPPGHDLDHWLAAERLVHPHPRVEMVPALPVKDRRRGASRARRQQRR